MKRNLLIPALFLMPTLAAAQQPTPAEGRPTPVERQWTKLLEVRVIHVEPLEGEGAAAIRAMLIGAVQRAGLFILTEDPEKADAFLRGSAEDLIFSDYDRYRTGLNVRGSSSGSRRESGESKFGSASFGIGETDEASIRERKHEAMAAVRIVLRDGEIVWTSTQESQGAKYRGSAADVAAKVTRELEKALARAREIQQGSL